MTPIDRRQFLKRLGQGTLGLAALSIVPACEFIDVQARGDGGDEFSFLTPQDDGIWFWQSGQGITKEDAPRIAEDAWRLRCTLSGGDTVEFSVAELRALADAGEEITFFKTLRCVFSANVGSPLTTLVANGLFTGVSLASLLGELNLPADIVKLHTFGTDGFTSNLPLERVFDEARLPPILAFELNGEPLSRLRGGPVRLVIPEMWGYKNVKWLERLHFSRSNAPFGNYETDRFLHDPRIDTPAVMGLGSTLSPPLRRNAEVQGPDIAVSGTAVVGDQAIDRVLVSIDDGPEQVAQLTGDDPRAVRARLSEHQQAVMDRAASTEEWPLENVWVHWHHIFEGLTPGLHTLTVRAVSFDGRKQPDSGGDLLENANAIRLSFSVI